MIGFRGDDYVVANRNDKTKYVQSGGILKSHEDVNDMDHEQIYRTERQRLDRPKPHNRPVAETCGVRLVENLFSPAEISHSVNWE